MFQELSEGLYGFEEPSFDSSKPLVIGVHPFYYRNDKKEENQQYVQGVERLVLEHDGPIMILEESPLLEKTAKEIEKFGRTNGIFFVNTQENSPNPAELYWKELFDYVNRLSNGEVRLFGGEYLPDATDSVKASFRRYVSEEEGLRPLLKKQIERVATHACCLGYFEAVLRCYDKHDVKVIEELTFK